METFASFELAEKSLLDQMIWVRRGAKKYEKTTRSYKQFYRFKLVKARSKVQCSSGCYIILNANNTFLSKITGGTIQNNLTIYGSLVIGSISSFTDIRFSKTIFMPPD